MNVPILATATTWQEYEFHFINTLEKIKKDYHIQAMVFGDIDLQPHRDWEEKVCAAAQLQALLPIWQRNRKELVMEMLHAGIETMIVSCNNTMGETFLGRVLNEDLVRELEILGVDVCGENGEFHTLVLDCPLFRERINVKVESKVLHNKYWFTMLRSEL